MPGWVKKTIAVKTCFFYAGIFKVNQAGGAVAAVIRRQERIDDYFFSSFRFLISSCMKREKKVGFPAHLRTSAVYLGTREREREKNLHPGP